MEEYNKASIERLGQLVQGQKTLFVTTKDTGYIRNAQEIALLKEFASSLTVCGSESNRYLTRLLKVFFWLLFHSLKSYDVVFLGFAPQLITPIFHRKFRHSVLIIDFFISMYDTLAFDRKKLKPSSWLARFIKKHEISALQRADHVVADTYAHGDYFVRELGLNINKLIVLYLEADKSVFYPMPNHRENDRLKVLYFGSILPLQGVDIVIECIISLHQAKDLEFTVIGPLSKAQKASLASFDNVRLFDWIALKELAKEIGRSDLCLGGHFSADIEKARRTIPGKTFIYRAMQKPVVLGECPANRELFQPSDDILFVPQGNPGALAESILAYRDKRGRSSI